MPPICHVTNLPCYKAITRFPLPHCSIFPCSHSHCPSPLCPTPSIVSIVTLSCYLLSCRPLYVPSISTAVSCWKLQSEYQLCFTLIHTHPGGLHLESYKLFHLEFQLDRTRNNSRWNELNSTWNLHLNINI